MRAMPHCRWFALAFLLAGCFEQDSPARSTVLPTDYQATFVKARSCRATNGNHDGPYMLVRANSAAKDSYLGGSYPLPAGSVLVAEEYEDPDCNTLAGLKVMYKEKPGYDSAHADWRWQRLDAYRNLLEDGPLSTCASCHASSCPTRDLTCSQP
jgi:hypothetical protein